MTFTRDANRPTEKQIQSANPKRKVLNSILRLAFVGILAFLALGSWAIASPVGSSPDDDFHLTSIWCADGGYSGMCEAGQSPSTRMVAAALNLNHICFAKYGDTTPKCQTDSNVLHDFTLAIEDHGNYSGGYPPLYYSVMHLFSSTHVATSAILMRLFTIILFIGLCLTLWVNSSSRSKPAQRLLWFVTLVPLGMFLLASNNPSSWTIIGVGVATLSAYELLSQQHPKIRFFSLLAVFIISALMAAGSRADGAAYLVICLTGVAIALFKSLRNNPKRLFLIGSGYLIAGAFFLTSRQATAVSAGFGDLASANPSSPLTLFANNILHFPSLLIGAFTGWEWGLGWFDTPMPEGVWVVACAIFVSVLAISTQHLDRYSGLAFTFAGLAVAVVPMYVMQISNIRVGELIQPRYIYPMLIGLAALALLVVNAKKDFGSRYWRWLVFASVSIVNFLALYINLHRYTAGALHPLNFNLNSHLQWWWTGLPISPMAVLVIGGASFTLVSLIMIRPWTAQIRVPECS